jgi:histidine triad (HIT) family protein
MGILVRFVFSSMFFFVTIDKNKAQTKTYQQRKNEQMAGTSPFQRDIEGVTKRILYKDSFVTVLDGNTAVNQLPVHLLAVTNRRIFTLNEMTETDQWLIGHMIWVLKNEAKKIGIDSTGYRITFNTNEDAGQSAFHIHAHLLGGAKTGGMVDQGWRNVQRAKRATTDTAYLTSTTRNVFLIRMMGLWVTDTDEGEIFCEPELNFKYMKLSLKRSIPVNGKSMQFEGRAIYKPGAATNTYEGIWYDTNNDVFEISASADSTTLTANWGNGQTKQGKTTYTFISNNLLEVTDYIMRPDSEWRMFSKLTFKRKF